MEEKRQRVEDMPSTNQENNQLGVTYKEDKQARNKNRGIL